MTRLGILLSVLAAPALGQGLPCPPKGAPVADHAKALDAPAVERITNVCRGLLDDRGIPLLVVTIPSIVDHGGQGLSIERFAVRTVREWREGLESDGRDWDKVILMLVAVNDRKCRIELGKAWGTARNADCSTILDRSMLPEFRSGDYGKGIEVGVGALDSMARGNEFAQGLPCPPAESPVADHAKVLDPPAVERIAKVCRELQEDREMPLLVVTIPSIEDYGGEGLGVTRFARETVSEWRQDLELDGRDSTKVILVLLAAGDRQSRIELGDWFTPGDSIECGKILEQWMLPRFRTGDYAGGIEAGLKEIDLEFRGWTRYPRPKKTSYAWVFIAVPGLLAAFTGVSLVRRGTKGAAWRFWRGIFSFLPALLAASGGRSYGPRPGYGYGYRGGGGGFGASRSPAGASSGGGGSRGSSRGAPSYGGGGGGGGGRGATGSW